jgi:hypothetical protein
MTALATMTVDRSGMPGSLAALVIDSEGFNTYCIDAAGFGRVGRTPRETLATPSPFVHGQTRSAVVLEESTLVRTVRVQAASSSALATAVTALEDALFQFVYTVTDVVDGVTRVWTAYPATIQSTDALIAFERVKGFHEDLTISIPVYPVSA